jgi:hypothetical protein
MLLALFKKDYKRIQSTAAMEGRVRFKEQCAKYVLKGLDNIKQRRVKQSLMADTQDNQDT